MGHATNIYGIISIPAHTAQTDRVWRRNLEIIAGLPAVDPVYPQLSSTMFHRQFQMGYDERLLPFAANYKNLKLGRIPEWIEKFEALIRQLMWLSVTAQIETEVSGNFEIGWVVAPDWMAKWKEEPWLPTQKWTTNGLEQK